MFTRNRKIRETRECPVDWTPLRKEIRKPFRQSVEVDVCPKCQGIFLDKKEVEAMTGSHRLHKLLTKYTGLNSNVQLLCPNCGGLMEAEDAGGIRVDVCLDCFGVWLAAGELERLEAMPHSTFRHLTPEEMAEYRAKKEIELKDHLDAVRSMLLELRRL
ncbi:MAG TPA: zf-TFIIB domain-containing protein [Thermoplasmata archaeon]|nr:zf-TFIIB domain-containing protein [Thermoplasmata archaeon]